MKSLTVDVRSELKGLIVVSKKYLPDVEKILARRHDNGADFWSTNDGKLLVGDPYSTITSLLVLHELRVAKSHEAVRGALNLLWNAHRPDGRFRIAPKGAMYPCHTALIAAILCRFGFAKDKRLQSTFDYLLSAQNEDGGWRCNTAPVGRSPETDWSNPGVTLFALDAFRFNDKLKADRRLVDAIKSVLDHWDIKRPIGPCKFGIGTQFHQVEYPFLRYNLFYYVYILSFYPRARKDSRFKLAFSELAAKQNEKGRMIVEKPHRKLGKELIMCAKGAASELATGRFREILENLKMPSRT